MHIKTETSVGLFVIAAVGAFVCMAYQFDFFRIDKGTHATYYVSFKDIAGLGNKADVKIAGVKVGWVDRIELRSPESRVQIAVKVPKELYLYTDARPFIRQEGILGTKFIDIVPGNSEQGRLAPGAELEHQQHSAVSIDEVMGSLYAISQNLKEMSGSLQVMMEKHSASVQQTIVQTAQITQTVNRMLEHNEGRIGSTMGDLSVLVAELKATLPGLLTESTQVMHQLNQTTVPAAQRALEHIGQTTDQIQQLIGQVAPATGALSQLMTNSRTQQAVGATINTVADCVDVIRQTRVTFNGRAEWLFPFLHEPKNTKVYLDGRIYPGMQRFFVLGGATLSHLGYAKQKDIDAAICTKGVAEHTYTHVCELKKDSWKPNIQVGCLFTRGAARFGIFEGTAGLAVDYAFYASYPFSWITTVELYDFTGKNRLCCEDRRPHLKWLNRLFFSPYISLDWGFDDICSKEWASGFVGLGVRYAFDHIREIGFCY